MRHTGSLRLSGSPRSFGLNPKCSHTAAVAFGFETNSMSQLASRLFALLCSRLKHSRLPTQSPCDWQAPPPHTKDNATDKRVHFSYAKETRVVIQSRITNKYANEIIEVIFFFVRLIDLSTIATGLSGPTPADDMAPQTITDCGNFTLDLKQHGFCASPLFLQTLGPWFPKEMQNVLSSENITLDHSAAVQSFLSLAQARRFWRCLLFKSGLTQGMRQLNPCLAYVCA